MGHKCRGEAQTWESGTALQQVPSEAVGSPFLGIFRAQVDNTRFNSEVSHVLSRRMA